MEKEEGYYELWLEKEVFKRLDTTREVTDEEVYEKIDELLLQIGEKEYLPVEQKMKLRSYVFHSMRGMDVLTPLLENEEITEIMVNAYNMIFVEKGGVVQKTDCHFLNKEKYHDVIQQIVADCNRVVNEASPIVDARLMDGSRVNVVLSPVSLDGATLTIRKFPKEALTMEKLIGLHSLDEMTAQFLQMLVKSGYNILISGGTGSGKTTFLNALSNYIPKTERIITIEDSAELQLHGVENLVRLEVRNANVEGMEAITMKDLIRSSLRMRPDRIVIGEVRGAEALDMLQAMNTGHDGSISTAHANSAKDLLSRLETMVMMGFDMPITALRGQISSAIEIIVHLGRLRDHTRRVLEIVEVLGMDNGEIQCQTLFRFEEERDERMQYHKTGNKKDQYVHVKVQGQLVYFHELKQIKKLKQSGYYERYLELQKGMKVGS